MMQCSIKLVVKNKFFQFYTNHCLVCQLQCDNCATQLSHDVLVMSICALSRSYKPCNSYCHISGEKFVLYAYTSYLVSQSLSTSIEIQSNVNTQHTA